MILNKIKWKDFPKPQTIPIMHTPYYSCMFGMYEMEIAAMTIVAYCTLHDITWKKARMYMTNFHNDELRTGFLYLVLYGWLKESDETGCFRLTKKFVATITKFEDHNNV